MIKNLQAKLIKKLAETASETSGSIDPNAKTGPSGYGTLDLVRADVLLPYRVDFENETQAGFAFVHWSGDVDTVGDVYAADTTITAYADFTVTANFAPAQKVQIQKGFNLIAIPANVSDQLDLKNWLPVLGDATEIERVMVYDKATGRFIGFVPGDAGNPSFLLQGGEGLILYALEEKTLELPTGYCPAWTLVTGSNLVGSACTPGDLSAYDLLTALGGNAYVSVLAHFDPETGRIETTYYDDLGREGSGFPIQYGEDYIIDMRQDVLEFRP